MSFDPIELEVLWQRLITIADEIDTATIRTSFSTIVGESHDFGCVLMDEQGRGLAQAQWSPPQFCTILPMTTRAMLERYPAESLRPGDVLVTNDPWLGTGHLPDYILVSPVFHHDRVVAFLGTVAHVSDVGGHRGDLEALDVFQEGTRLGPTFFTREGIPDELVRELIASNCRVPDMVMGDLRAIEGTHRVGARRILELLEDHALNDLRTLSAAILDRSEQAMRAAIQALPDGESTFEVTGDGYFEPFTLRLRMAIRAGEIHFDYGGTSPEQRNASINVSYNMTVADSVYPIKCMLAPHIPNNDGLTRPLHVTVPEGSILNCRFPAPVKARAKTGKHIPPLIFGAFASLLPDEAIAGAGGIFPFHFVGDEPGYGPFAVHVLPHGGTGATSNEDGWPPVAFPDNSTITPIEIAELGGPFLILKKALITDSGGAGRRRGGPGQEYALKCVSDHAITLTVRPDQVRFPAPGLEGGLPGSLGDVLMNGTRLDRFPPLEMKRGDICIIRVPGGAGYGDPRTREAHLVQHDVDLGLVSPEAARAIYGRP